MKSYSVCFTILVATTLVIVAVMTMSCSSGDGSVIIKEYELRGERWQSMHALSEDFRTNVYPRCLAESGLSMSCSRCEYIYMDVVIFIDTKGRMASYSKKRENVCGKDIPEKLERCFIEYFESVTFPQNLRNMSIEMKLGTGLKC